MSMAVAKADGFVDVDDEQSDVDQEIAENVRQLTPKAQDVFWAYVENSILPNCNKITDKALAAKMGISDIHLYRLKTYPCWVRAYQLVIINSALSRTLRNADEYIDNLEESGRNGDTNANKALLNITGILKNTSGINVNINTKNQSSQSTDNPIEIADRMIISLAKLGMSSDAIVDRYITLRNEGAF